jgi:uncharacterized SAM-binding protein YcdF (DUF218 family)
MRAVLLLVLVPVALFLLLCGFLAVLLHLVPSLIHVLPWAGIVIVFGGRLRDDRVDGRHLGRLDQTQARYRALRQTCLGRLWGCSGRGDSRCKPYTLGAPSCAPS